MARTQSGRHAAILNRSTVPLGPGKTKPPTHKIDRTTVNKAQRYAGVCALGHDITAPGALTESRRTYRCRACQTHHRTRRVADKGMCAAGLHEQPEGARGCKPCRRVRDKQRRAEATALRTAALGTLDLRGSMLKFMPPAEVLKRAACSPETAKLFDPITRGEQNGDAWPLTEKRLADAQAICARCPVREACLEDAYEHARVGVFGGQYLSPRIHAKRAGIESAADSVNAEWEDLPSWEVSETIAP